MTMLNLKPTHKPVKAYYDALQQFAKLGVSHELAVKDAFADLLKACCQQFDLTLIPEKEIKLTTGKRIRVDGALVRDGSIRYGIWEAKDSHDKLDREVKQKFAVGYPQDNIIFQAPERAILWQGGKQICDEDITKPQILVDTLKLFFEYRTPEIAQWETAASEFRSRVKDLSGKLINLIETQRKTNPKFIQAFREFTEICRQAINPNLSEAAVEEMLIQHLLTERIFRQIFNNPDFTRRNIIAVEIEKVIQALTSKSFSREHFLGEVDYFYRALEDAAKTINDYSDKQHFLNTVYEKFFQGFAVKVADIHGIVYTPQPIVNFMVKSVEDILKKEFGKSLNDKGVHILDPFLGTGNFILRVMQEIRKTALPYKYEQELHCNEVMLLPYYIASMNIEHQYFEATGGYKAFEGICLVDTFSDQQVQQLSLFTPENTARVQRQRSSPIFVIIGNPPYNAWQVNENDNNKNLKYEEVDRQIRETYAKDSKATNKSSLSDPYVKAIRWASNRIGDEGIIALVTNNSFIDALAFDGMRKHLEKDFNLIYLVDLGGNIRKTTDPSKSIHNVFDIKVGVSINIFIRKNRSNQSKDTKIYYASVDEFWRKEEKLGYLEQSKSYSNIEWSLIEPDQKSTWLTEGLKDDFENFLPIGNKETKDKSTHESAIFRSYSMGVQTNRDVWVYNFDKNLLIENIKLTLQNYNHQVDQWKTKRTPKDTVDSFVIYDDTKIKWSSHLKECLNSEITADFNDDKIRLSMYRPFCVQLLYFDEIFNHRRGQFPLIFPTPDTEKENRVIAVTNHSQIPFLVQITNCIPSLDVGGRPGQCFPFYTYDEDGTNRKDNITDWSLEQFRNYYQDQTITKWDIFYYTYGLLHHPIYRERYAANLKRELPRIPYAPDFRGFVNAGQQLADLHLNYEKQPEYPLKFIENDEFPLDLLVDKMKLSKNKTQIIYNEFLTLSGIPPEVFEYRLGNRSALDWIINQYQVKIDKRSGIVNDPNRLGDEQYIMRLISQVITVSLETVKIVNHLPDLGLY
ncbi:DNA or RNA helicase of superfamily II [Planktothrix tepida]|uniref:site-specific DNA-methyltransferase (adenine-specific) n=1 Tax=Planktothrix tepida PCC 9214 TaxID=671072 RepID=A0A1J1LGF4_9CYAN|nr:type ISP restriction/modification enzyme [Planktothrix tepida]CAD5923056.1 DNA or RNA helicase of superfamily II [Planktothrix tepida]CUR31082.1 DNA or RNA helicase of superfamily II [Planktothrix tepida PCC 9214]